MKYFDWPLLLIVLVISLFGVVCIFSATSSQVTESPANVVEMLQTQSILYPRLQLMWIGAGLVAMAIVIFFPYELYGQYANAIYAANIGLLVFTLLVAQVGRGGMTAFLAWGGGDRGFQTSEVGKVAIIIAFVLMLIPLWYFMNNSASDNFRFTRILIWLDPESYPDNARQVINGQIAIGSGGLLGKGIVSPGSFASLGYISDDHTDFIFAIVCESFGLVGGCALVFAYMLMIARLIWLSIKVNDPFGSYLIVGVTAMLLFHVIENVGMVIGLLPVTGIPLPFVSYGGSNMLTNMMGIGLVQNVVMRSRQRELQLRTSTHRVVQI